RPPDPPRQHPRNEWRQLSPRPKPGTKNRQSSPIRAPTLRAGNSGRATPSRRSPLAAQGGLLLRRPMADFCSAVDNPRWAADVLGRSLLRGSLPRFAHHPRAAETSILGRGVPPMRHQQGLSWDHIRQVRDRWNGNLVLKGILAPEDARLALEHGADGIVVSSHGGRNFDSTAAPIDCLPAIREAVGPDTVLFADSGVQNGSDILKLLRAG